MKNFFKAIASLAVFVVTIGAVISFLSEKAKEHRYIVMDDNGNELF